MSNLIIVDDKDVWRQMLAEAFKDETAINVHTAANLAAARVLLSKQWPDVVILDALLPETENGHVEFRVATFLSELREASAGRPLPDTILISEHDSVADSFNLVAKWLDTGEISDVLAKSTANSGWFLFQAIIRHKVIKLLKYRGLESALLDDLKTLNEHGFITNAPTMVEVSRLVDIAAKTGLGVLIHGENGTGKTHLARIIHALSHRSGAKYHHPNSADANVEGGLARTVLFGGKKGVADLPEELEGWFRAADGGTLLIDEIGNLSRAAQKMLLTAIEDQEISPLGYDNPISVDVRVLTATSANLRERIKEGGFDEALYGRIAQLVIEMPPLRSRVSDITPLVKHFLGSPDLLKSEELVLSDDEQKELFHRLSSEGTIHAFENYDWPRNVRELRNLLAVIVSYFKLNKDYRTNDEVKKVIEAARIRKPAESHRKASPPSAIDEVPTDKAVLENVLRAEIESKFSKQTGVMPTWRALAERHRPNVENILRGLLSTEGQQLFEAFNKCRASTGIPNPGYYSKVILFLALQPSNEATLSDLESISAIDRTQIANNFLKVFGIGELNEDIKKLIRDPKLDTVRVSGQKLVKAQKCKVRTLTWVFKLMPNVLQSSDPVSA